jgi:hypothetical protein
LIERILHEINTVKIREPPLMATSIEIVDGIKLVKFLQELVLLVKKPFMKVSEHGSLKHAVILAIWQVLANLLQIIINGATNDLHQSQFLQRLKIVINLLRILHNGFKFLLRLHIC